MGRTLTELECPKCGGVMRAQERQGIVIDVCRDCRGVFLDRGELDRLLDLETASTNGDRMDRYDDRPYGRDDDRRHRDDDRPSRGAPHQRKRRGFLGELLEGFGD